MTIVKLIFSQSRKKTFADSFRIRFIIAKPWLAVIFLLLFSGFTCFVNAQTVLNPEWVRNYSERDSITNIPAAIDANGNIYVTGSTYVIGQNYNVTTIKYNQNGDTVWVRHYNGSANGYDGATALGLDGSGNIFITGRSQGTGTGYDILTLKYNASGTLLWEQRYDGPIHGNDMPTGLALDNSGNVYITGYSVQAGTTTDFITIKYSSAGIQNWVKTYNGPGNGNDRSIAIYLKNNRVFITGFGYETGGTYTATTISYLGSNGNQTWIKKYGSSASIPDAGGCAIAQYGANIFVSTTTGTSGNYDYITIAYNNANGNQQWLTIYNAYNLNDIVSSATTDNNGNIFVTGRNLNSNGKYEYHTVKYSQSGVQQWVNKQQVNLTNARTVNKITVDTYNMIYVCGEKKPGYNSDMFLCQITQGGNTQWTETYNGLANGDDVATDMVTDNLGRIFLTGQTYNGNAKFDYTTIKYSQSFIYYPPDFNNEPASSSLSFYENKGQIINTNNNLVPDVRYYSQGSNPSLYFTNTILSYVFSGVDTSSATVDTLHRIDQVLLNSNPLARIFANETAPGYLNYYLAHCPQGITDVEGYKRLFIPNIYPNIDLHYFSNANGIKSYFVVKPGGNPKDIALQFAGVVNAHIEPNGHLTVNSSIGNIEYDVPTAYQVTPSQNIIPLNWSADWQYFSSPNTVFFKTGNFNTSLPLVIQVDLGHALQQQVNYENLIWSSYFGGPDLDRINSINISNDGFKSIIGHTTSDVFPDVPNLITGSFLSSNVLLVIFNEYNERLSTAIIGGTSNDYGQDVVFGNNKNVYLTGFTFSSDFCTMQNNFYSINNSTNSGFVDWFVAEYDYYLHKLKWNTYFGGNNADYSHKILYDVNNYLYVIGYAHEGLPSIPLTGASNYTYNGNGNFNTYILKINPDGQAIWGTYYGGEHDICPYSACFDNNNNLFIVGETDGTLTQSNNPLGSWVHSYAGGLYDDGFIIRFDNQGLITWATCFGGTSAEYVAGKNSVIVDDNFNIYIVGNTLSSDFPKININNYPTFDDQINGTDGFIMQFDSNFDLLWSTYYGGSNSEKINAICLYDDNIIISGYTNSSNFDAIQLTGAFYQQYSVYDDYDGFITCLNSDREIIWSTCFGGGGSVNSLPSDLIFSMIIYDDYLLLSGITSSSNLDSNYNLFPLVDFGNNAYYQELYGNNSDGFISMFDLSPLISVPEYLMEQSYFSIYPNPTDEEICVSINCINNKNIDINIYNMAGVLIYQTSIKNVIDKKEFKINIKSLQPGAYTVQIVTNKLTSSKKLIKF